MKEEIDFNDYELVAHLSFTRREGDQTTFHSIALGSEADTLQPTVQAMFDFIKALGFRFVASVQVCNEDGKVVASSVNT